VGDYPATQSSSAAWQDYFPHYALRDKYLLQLGMPQAVNRCGAEMNRILGLWTGLTLTLSLVPLLALYCEAETQNPPSPLEITQVDLLGSKNWDSTRISIMGVRLGMSRQETFKVIQQWEAHLDDAAGQGCLKEYSCDVYKWDRYAGVSIVFNDDEIVNKIRIDAYRRDAPKGDSFPWIGRNFHGETSRLVSLYSESSSDADNLRARLLGPPNSFTVGKFQQHRPKPPGDPVHYEYWYGRLGLLFMVNVNLDYFNSETEKLTMEFVQPHMR